MAKEVPAAATPEVKPGETIQPYLSQIYFLRGFPETEEAFLSLCRAYEKFVSTEEVNHKYLGTVIPAQWLMDEIASSRNFLPSPIQARRLYETFFAPKDGRSAESLEQAE